MGADADDDGDFNLEEHNVLPDGDQNGKTEDSLNRLRSHDYRARR